MIRGTYAIPYELFETGNYENKYYALMRIGLSAVIEDTAGSLSYWALHHPRSKPDFHHRGGFILRLTAPLL